MSSPKTFAVSYEEPAAGRRTTAIARELSLGGMFVVTDSPPDEGTLLAVELDLEGIKVSVDARVLRREPDGMAVVFIDLPDDVAATLSAAVTPASARTILGVGSGNIKATTPGIAVPPSDPRVPVAVPSITTTTPGIVSPPSREEPKRKPPAKPEVEEPQRESSVPPPKSGGAGRWLLLLLLAGAGAAAYVYRAPLLRELESAFGPAPKLENPDAAVAAPTAVAVTVVDATAEAAADAAVEAATDASSDAGADAAVDGGRQDAGAHDAGAHDGGRRDAGAHK